ncbi:MAG: LLM class flavin-dependent oxidoreductase, partial [Algicola sp.]|nr:LLM class flavin-dependent oxidoreductase [Algicola sp.]
SGFDGPVIEVPTEFGVHQLIAQKAEQAGALTALKDTNSSLTYNELNQRVAILAEQLTERGIRHGDRVGVSLDRGIPMVVAMLAAMTCGAAYVPVDVNFPDNRKQQICQDAQLACVITNPAFVAPFNDWSIPALLLEDIDWASVPAKALAAYPAVKPDDVAYVIYTSGSTGKPKGVMVSHGNVVNLFVGLDESLAPSLEQNDQPTFRALTSISFDISVLELFWTLARGFKVIVEQDHFSALADERAQAQKVNISAKASELEFSMFYFASDQTGCDDKYFLLREGATFADNNGFSAVWVPERHFHNFGGQFANPAIAAAAVSVLTKNIEIRSGSCVLPLHNIIRVAEEWSMVDNLSNGRVAMAVASGWHFNDFVLAPDNFENRHQILKDSIQTLRKLWAGEKVTFVNGKGTDSEIQIHPKPIRRELPLWVTAAANPETFRYAGSIGANVLTHFLGQSAAELKDKIAIYRQARTDNGFDAEQGKVTLMLHTYMSDSHDKAMQTIEKPFKDYLRTSINLLLPVAQSTGLDTKEDLEAVVDAGFLRYAKSSALFGTPESCLQLASDMSDIGVTEIGCLIDFGVEDQAVVDSFVHIKRFKDLLKQQGTNAVELDQDRATHIQCTPSYAQLLLASIETKQSLKHIRGFMVGGEPLTPELAEQINELIPGKLFNMYGPTETCVWSAVNQVQGNDANIGLPIANTRMYVLDKHLQVVPTGVKGELYIAGQGVTLGYWQRPDLTEKQFLDDPFSNQPGAKLYRTGDLVRRLADGRMVFLGRIDNQVKVRGYRIELDEIKQALADYPGVEQAVVTVHRTEQKAAAILAYVLPQSKHSQPSQHTQDTQQAQPLQSSALIEYLKTRIPDYMVPSALFILSELPYTPNGKLDLKALPTEVAAQPRKLVPVANDTEFKVAEIWQGLLKIEQIGTQESFFELGGHSLLLGKMQQQLKDRFDITIEIIDLFKYPTINSLSQRLSIMMAPVEPQQKRNARQVDRASVNQVRNQMRQRNRRGK